MDMSAPALLRAFRRDRGLSAARLATLIGVTRQMVHHLERGERPPGLALAVRIERLTDGWARGPIRPWQWLPVANDNDVPVPPAAEGAA